MVLVIVCSFSMSAFAADSAVVPSRDLAVSQEEGVETLGLGSIIASGITTINGTSASIAVYLPSGNFWADLVAGIGYMEGSGTVTVSVLTPDKNTISLGTISGTGSYTIPYQVTYAPAGYYYFYFLSTSQSPVEVYARIHD